MMDNLEIIMDIIVHGGNARSKAMEAIKLAKEGKVSQAKTLLDVADKEITCAHHVQTGLIQDETRGNKTDVSLFMVHAQDHLMNAMTIRDMASEIIDLYEIIQNLNHNEIITGG